MKSKKENNFKCFCFEHHRFRTQKTMELRFLTVLVSCFPNITACTGSHHKVKLVQLMRSRFLIIEFLILYTQTVGLLLLYPNKISILGMGQKDFLEILKFSSVLNWHAF